MRFEVIVGNVGTVYRGDDQAEALATFADYVYQSKGDTGRAAGESVALMDGDTIAFEHIGTQVADEYEHVDEDDIVATRYTVVLISDHAEEYGSVALHVMASDKDGAIDQAKRDAARGQIEEQYPDDADLSEPVIQDIMATWTVAAVFAGHCEEI